MNQENRNDVLLCNKVIAKKMGPWAGIIYERIRYCYFHFSTDDRGWSKSILEFAEEIGCARSTFKREISKLIELGLIEKVRGRHVVWWVPIVGYDQLENHFKKVQVEPSKVQKVQIEPSQKVQIEPCCDDKKAQIELSDDMKAQFEPSKQNPEGPDWTTRESRLDLEEAQFEPSKPDPLIGTPVRREEEESLRDIREEKKQTKKEAACMDPHSGSMCVGEPEESVVSNNFSDSNCKELQIAPETALIRNVADDIPEAKNTADEDSENAEKENRKQIEVDFEDYWKLYRGLIKQYSMTVPAGNKAEAKQSYLRLRISKARKTRLFSAHEIILATNHYFEETGIGNKTKHCCRFLKPELIAQYQEEPDMVHVAKDPVQRSIDAMYARSGIPKPGEAPQKSEPIVINPDNTVEVDPSSGNVQTLQPKYFGNVSQFKALTLRQEEDMKLSAAERFDVQTGIKTLEEIANDRSRRSASL